MSHNFFIYVSARRINVMVRYNFHRGMTLIEMLITVVIIGILTAIALPSYSKHVESARRSEAQTGLIQLQLWAEQQYTISNNYPSSTDLSTGSPSCASCSLSSEYTFSISNTGTGVDRFILTAKVKPNGLQKNDKCKKLTINAAGEKKGYTTGIDAYVGCW
ncbi:type IV pilin protein [Photobacterium rosenbergii]|nr:type IV pilin protein [Photobacterium rosenbergii]